MSSIGRAPSRIEYDAVTKTLRELVDSLTSETIAIPPHQREFCWTLPNRSVSSARL